MTWKLSYEEVIQKVGEFGIFQKKVIVLILLCSIPHAMQTLSAVFTAAIPEFRCAVPFLMNDSFKAQSVDHERSINRSIPIENGKFSECSHYKMFRNSGFNDTHYVDFLNKTSSCSRWVYSDDVYASTIVTKLDLVCDRHMYTAHVNMMTLCGLLVGSIVGGVVSDRFGRKKTILVFLILQLIAGSSLAFIQSIHLMLVMRLLVTTFSLAYYIPSFVLCTELVGPKYRVIASSAIMFGWVLGMFLLVFIAYFVRHWQTLQLVLAASVLPFLTYWWLIPESPRWLMTKGRFTEAEELLMKMAKGNNREISDKFLLGIEKHETGTETFDTDSENESGSNSRTLGLVKIFKSTKLLFRFCILCLNWMACSLVYYGLTLNVGSMIEGSIYLNFALMSAMEGLSYFAYILLLDRVGRKSLNATAIISSGLACLLMIWPLLTTFKGRYITLNILSNVGKFGVTMSFAAMFTFTAEQMPTPVRNSGVGACSLMGRIGGVISPYIANLHHAVDGNVGKVLPLIVFGSFTVFAGLTSLLLPETAHRKLPETIEEAENIMTRRQILKSKQDVELVNGKTLIVNDSIDPPTR